MCMFRDLKASEIEARVGQARENGITLLLYKDARVDMAILDETVGQARWQREHYEVKGNLYCRVGIKIDSEWIWKADCGTESNTEAEKGESSDSFKRACVNWGIGRELYTAPFIWVASGDCKIMETTDRSGKKVYKCYDSFSVTSIEIKDKAIIALQIKNDKTGKIVYTYGAKPQNTPNSANTKQQLPFPEAEHAPQVGNKPHSGLETKNTSATPTIDEQRQWAINFKAETGPRAGMTLGDIYKLDKPAYMRLQAEPPSVECAKAIAIINEWVGIR